MDLEEVVEKYISDRESTLQYPHAWTSLLRLGHDEGSTAALASGARYLLKRLFGRASVLLAIPDGEDHRPKPNIWSPAASAKEPTHAKILCFERNQAFLLNGQDSALLELRKLEPGQGLLWQALEKRKNQLVGTRQELQDDPSYLEFSAATTCVFSVPIVGPTGALGVVSIDTDDPHDIVDATRNRFILNYIEVVLIFLLNSRLQEAESAVENLDLERKALLRERRVSSEALYGDPETWRLLLRLFERPMEVSLDRMPTDSTTSADALGTVSRCYLHGLITAEGGELKLTSHGSQKLEDVKQSLGGALGRSDQRDRGINHVG